jgi:hypothetical protein
MTSYTKGPINACKGYNLENREATKALKRKLTQALAA